MDSSISNVLNWLVPTSWFHAASSLPPTAMLGSGAGGLVGAFLFKGVMNSLDPEDSQKTRSYKIASLVAIPSVAGLAAAMLAGPVGLVTATGLFVLKITNDLVEGIQEELPRELDDSPVKHSPAVEAFIKRLDSLDFDLTIEKIATKLFKFSPVSDDNKPLFLETNIDLETVVKYIFNQENNIDVNKQFDILHAIIIAYPSFTLYDGPKWINRYIENYKHCR